MTSLIYYYCYYYYIIIIIIVIIIIIIVITIQCLVVFRTLDVNSANTEAIVTVCHMAAV